MNKEASSYLQEEDKKYSWLYENGYGEGPVGRLIEFLGEKLLQCQNILDAGCGRQGFAKFMKEQAPNLVIVGVDISVYIADTAEHCKVYQASLDELPFEDQNFDCVFSCDVLEHIPEKRVPGALKELYRVLKPGGLWAFSIGTGPSGNKGPAGENLHLTQKNPGWWQKQLADQGYNNIEETLTVQGGVLFRGLKRMDN